MLNPNKWEKLFKDKRVSVCTSFQYGNGRKWDNDTVYDEQMFRKTFKQFKDLIGYPLSFIAVIDESNEIYAMKHYELAKQLGTTCKLNALMPLGKSKSFYPMHKIIKIWLDAIDAGYRPQMNMDVCFDGGCNLNTRCLCSSTIRSMMTASDGKLLYSNCEDDLVNNVFIPLDTTQPKAAKQHISLQDAICNNCMFCELFYLCNSCKQLRKMNKYTLDHCSNMLKLKDRIISAGWRLQP